MNILFTICGRAGSKGVKNKNLKSLLNKPLVYWSISAIDLFIKKQKFHNDIKYDVVLNTDSNELMDLVNNNRMLKIGFVERKNELAGDVVGKIDVIRDTFLEMEKRNITKYDVIVDLDITSPLRTEKDINNLLEKYFEGSADVVFSVTESRRNPYFNMVQRTSTGAIEKTIKSKYTSRQQAPVVYDLNASLYAYSPDFLKKNLQLFDAKSEIIEMKDTAVLDLDKLEDFEYMEVIASYLVDKYPDYKEVYDNIK